jgi:hypothetical protein
VRSDWRFSAAAIPRNVVPALAQMADFPEHTLLAGIGLDVLAVRAETESEPDIPDAPRYCACAAARPACVPQSPPAPTARPPP